MYKLIKKKRKGFWSFVPIAGWITVCTGTYDECSTAANSIDERWTTKIVSTNTFH